MSFGRTCVRLVNSFVSLILILAILLFGSYSAYALWDNNHVYNEARSVMIQMQELKPVLIEDIESGPTFDELLAINQDVRGWVTLDGTSIDFPILQGDSNFTYINTDVYGNFALAGSIFLDCSNNKDFSDTYNLIYGHHMANSNMFGDLDLYRDEKFFQNNTTGQLMTVSAVYDLEVLALVVVSASDDIIFDVNMNQNADVLLSFIKDNSVFCRDVLPQPDENTQFLALSTCSSDFSDARTVVITQMIRHRKPE
ncbi:MAG: class B sortase [Oscillospiraceae bacterium]|nr:class B sortase [Oscillospiraceae bacterium]